MDAKDTLVKVLKALLELKDPIMRQPFLDFIIGRETSEAEGNQWDDMETYGIAESHDDEFLSSLVDAAFTAGYIKRKPAKKDSFVITPAGKRFLKKPIPFEIKDEEEIAGELTSREEGLDDILQSVIPVPVSCESIASPKTKLQIKLIHAIDRKIALDDFAENENLSLDDVLDEVEKLIRQGKRLNITYFTDEVLGASCMDELLTYFREAKTDALDAAIREYGDVYNPEEIRLARIVFHSH